MKMIMKAIRIHQYGGPEVLAQVEMQRPAPGANEVLIKVHAASVNPVDWKMRAGYMKDFLPLSLPATLGSDVSLAQGFRQSCHSPAGCRVHRLVGALFQHSDSIHGRDARLFGVSTEGNQI